MGHRDDHSKTISVGDKVTDHLNGYFVTYQSTLISRLAFFPRVTLYLAKMYTVKMKYWWQFMILLNSAFLKKHWHLTPYVSKQIEHFSSLYMALNTIENWHLEGNTIHTLDESKFYHLHNVCEKAGAKHIKIHINSHQ